MCELVVERDWVSSMNQVTTLRDRQGRVRQIITSSIRQPKVSDKTIVVRGITYKLIFPWRG